MLLEKGVRVSSEGTSYSLLLLAETIIAINAAALIEVSFQLAAFSTP